MAANTPAPHPDRDPKSARDKSAPRAARKSSTSRSTDESSANPGRSTKSPNDPTAKKKTKGRAKQRSPYRCTLQSTLRTLHATGLSMREVARKIEEANRSNPGRNVDRRKLTAVMNGQLDVTWRLDELVSLAVFLDRELPDRSMTKVPLFEISNPLRTLAKSTKEVVFFIGSKPPTTAEHGRMDMSRWDVAGARLLEGKINDFADGFITDLQDVHLRIDANKARDALSEPWSKTFDDKSKSPLVVVGSPRASHAAELALSRMYDVEPYTDTGRHDPMLPFHFLWPDEDGEMPASSAFRLAKIHGKRLDPDKYDDLVQGEFGMRNADNRLLLGEPPHWKTARSYGVIVMQRRANGAPWLVVAGLNGVSTTVCCRAALGLDFDFPAVVSRTHSPVRSQLFEVKYQIDGPRSIEEVLQKARCKEIGEPIDWIPGKGIVTS